MKLGLAILNIGLMYAKNYLIDLHIINTQFKDKEKTVVAPFDASVNAINQSNHIIKRSL
jgi:hypothetical protein